MGLDSVEFVMEVEQRFRLSLPDSDCENVRTVADMAELVIARVPGSDRQTVMDEVRKLAADQAGMPLEHVHAHSDIVKDLGFD